MSVQKLQEKVARNWKAIDHARKFSELAKNKLTSAIQKEKLESTETSLIALGSLARKECVAGSDLDWTVLIDGQADPNHLAFTAKTRETIGNVTKMMSLEKPSTRGAFGNMVFSHDLLHSIGGEDDTNQNTTIRMLLLLESVAIGRSDARGRVLRNILYRYLQEDAFFASGTSKNHPVPRFLLNDIIRYWRIVAVDFANKRRELAGGWALRNIKLRMSRKLMFMSGLIMCFDCELKHNEIVEKSLFGEDPPDTRRLIQAFLERGNLNTAKDFFDAYDEFLARLANKAVRKHLKTLNYKTAATDEEFQNLRTISHKFEEAALNFFFHDNEDVKRLTRKYGLF